MLGADYDIVLDGAASTRGLGASNSVQEKLRARRHQEEVAASDSHWAAFEAGREVTLSTLCS